MPTPIDIKKQRTTRLLNALLVLLVLFTIATGYWFYKISFGPESLRTVSPPTEAAQPGPLGAVTKVWLPTHPETLPAEPEKPQPSQSTSQPSTPTRTAFTTPIQIKGDAACQSTTLDALKLLSDKAPTHYAVVTQYIGVIECASQGSGMFAYENPPRYLVGDTTRNAGTIWYAGTIAHDVGHSQLYNTYLHAHPGESVPGDVWTGESAERSCLDAQHDALSKIGASQTTLDYIKNVINTEYYDISYDQRWW
jgi:hypothetical protein